MADGQPAKPLQHLRKQRLKGAAAIEPPERQGEIGRIRDGDAEVGPPDQGVGVRRIVDSPVQTVGDREAQAQTKQQSPALGTGELVEDPAVRNAGSGAQQSERVYETSDRSWGIPSKECQSSRTSAGQ